MDDAPIDWIRTDNGSDLLNSLEHCLETLGRAQTDRRMWKWAVFAAHSAAQVSLVTCLDDSDRNHLKKGSQAAMKKFVEEAGPSPGELYLAEFMLLFERAKAKYAFAFAAIEREQVCSLNRIRNVWTHFGQYGYSVPVDVARQAVATGAAIVNVVPGPAVEVLFSDLEHQSRANRVLHSIMAIAGN